VFNATFNNISVMSWWSVLLVEETGGLGENHNISVMSWWSVLLVEETGQLFIFYEYLNPRALNVHRT
jgi:hypothetical protein